MVTLLTTCLFFAFLCVTCRDCTENKQPEAETSLVYDVLIWVIKKKSASSTSVEKEKRNKTCEACEV